MPRTDLDTLIRRVTLYFRKRADKYHLNPHTVEARYILNWGGFVNASFFIKDGQTTYHLKLADDEDEQARLARWATLHKRLSERYHAPRMLDWIKIPGLPFQGPLFEYIPGRPADFAQQPDVLRGVLELLPALHSDRDLAENLSLLNEGEGDVLEDAGDRYAAEAYAEDVPVPEPGENDLETFYEPPVYTCADYFLDVYIQRFDGDLVTIVDELPPFVPLSRVDWMQGETRELEAMARELPAFQHPADAPTHGDLWASNILVTRAGAWYIIDWDDLDLGDPALEYSIVLGPLWRAGVLTQAEMEAYLPADADFRARFTVCLRALLLDEIIDSLADWVESQFAPDHQDEVRAEKERVHFQALEMYQHLYA